MTTNNLNSFKNKYFTYIVIFALGAAFSFITSYFLGKNKVVIDLSETARKNDKTLATVNKIPIYLEDVELMLRQINPNIAFNSLDNKTKELVIKEVATQKLLRSEALKHMAHNTKLQNDNLSSFAALQVQQLYLDKLATKKVSEKKIKETYDQLAKDLEGKKEYKLQHILVRTKGDADQAMIILHNKSFEAAAKQYSLDKQTADNGGNLGYVVEGTLMPEFEKEIKNLAIDQTTRPFKTDLGWHIIKLTDKRAATPAKFEDVKEKIKASLANEEKQSYIKNLVEKSEIKILDANKS